MPAAKKGGGSKKPAKSTPTSSKDADDSYIVFTNSKDDPKSKGKGKKIDASKDANKDGQAGESSDQPKKPDTRTLIGGASWTGKLPLNMLSELCQKQKWAKPEYTMNKTPEGFVSSVILKSVHPKTKETISQPPLRLPATHKNLAAQPTAVEARHFAATYALFRVNSMKNIHMMLPPNYRDLWKGVFQELKQEDVKNGNGWMYEADPFSAKEEREQAQAAATKKREEIAKQKKNAEESGGPGVGGQGGSRNSLRGWGNVPKVDMGKKLRQQVEDLIRKHTVWNPHGTTLTQPETTSIVNELSGLGFRKTHVQEATEICKDKEEVLEWLIIHVPEDDLPRWCLPENYTTGISIASGNMQREAAIKRLSDTGYPSDLCSKMLEERGSEDSAAEALQLLLVDDEDESFELPDVNELSIESTASDTWQEELNTLEAIFGDRYQKITPTVCNLRLESNGTTYTLTVRKSSTYPATVPVLGLSKELPAYIRLSIYRKAIQHTKATLLGEPMIFNIVDWLEAEIPRIVENPGRLSDVAGAIVAGAPSERNRRNKAPPKRKRPVQWKQNDLPSQEAHQQWQIKQSTSGQQKMLAARQSLPAWRLRENIVRTVSNHQVTIISGETGSGKSTQSVQFILDDLIQKGFWSSANIICTQPRRISALGLADRVSEERCGTVGGEVGFAIRGESKQKPGTTKITFVTTGVLLRRLQTSGGTTADVVNSLADVSHVVIDEVHERSLDTDFLLVLLRDVLSQRKDLKVILMSATLDAAIFESYFRKVSSVGKVEIEGRTFPVTDFYLDDILRTGDFNSANVDMAAAISGVGMRINYDLLASTVSMIDAELGSVEGGILIFLPGVAEINRTVDSMRSIPNVHALPLHASLTPAEQKRVFPPTPRGKRKVIAATNVAETSITIADIVAVIDTGKVKETSFDAQNNMIKLEERWASLAACKQRRGRAGRVREGQCYKLYTRNAEAKMAPRPEPEIRRVPLEQLCLSVRAMGIRDVPAFLASAITPPDVMAVEGALDVLRRMGALDGNGLSALGRHLSLIPADLRLGKLMVLGALFGCLEASVTIAAILTVRSPFLSPQDKREESKAIRSSFGQDHGDLISDLAAYDQWTELRQNSPPRTVRAWCDDNFLNNQTLFDISTNRTQYLSSLKEAGFLPPSYSSSTSSSPSSSSTATLNAHSSSLPLLRALVAGAFSPQLARISFPDKKYTTSSSGAIELDPEARTIKYFTQDSGRVFIHPSSTLFDTQVFPGNSQFLAFFTKIATSKDFVRDLTPFNGYGLLMFAGEVGLDTLGRGVTVDGWLRMRGWARIGVLVGRLRGMVDGILARRMEGGDLGGEEDVLAVVRRLVELDGMDR